MEETNQIPTQIAIQKDTQIAIQKAMIRWILESKQINGDDLKYLTILLEEQHLKEYIKKYISRNQTKLLISCILNNKDMRKIFRDRIFYMKDYNFIYEDLSQLTFRQFKHLKILFKDNKSMHRIIYCNERLYNFDKNVSGEHFSLVHLCFPVYFSNIDISKYDIKDILIHCSGEVLNEKFLIICKITNTSIFMEDFKFTLNFLYSSLNDSKKLLFLNTICILSSYPFVGATTREEINEFNKLIQRVYNTCNQEFIQKFESFIKQHYTDIDIHPFFLIHNIENINIHLDFLTYTIEEMEEMKEKEMKVQYNLCKELDNIELLELTSEDLTDTNITIGKINAFLIANDVDISSISGMSLKEIQKKMELTIENATIVENMTLRGVQFTNKRILKTFQFIFERLVRNSGNFEFSDLKYVIVNWSQIFGHDFCLQYITEIINILIELNNIKYIYWLREIFKSMNLVVDRNSFIIPATITDFSNEDVINLLLN